MKRKLLPGLLVILVGSFCARAWAYDYPLLKDPYLATIVGTPEEFQPELPEKIDYEMLSLKVFPERTPPDVYWYQREFS